MYRKYLGEDQKDLHLKRARKEYSKVLFTVVAMMGANYAISLFNKKDDDSSSELFEALAGLSSEVMSVAAAEAELKRLESQFSPGLTRSFVDPESKPGNLRVVSVTQFKAAIFVSEYVYANSVPVRARTLTLQPGVPVYAALEAALKGLD